MTKKYWYIVLISLFAISTGKAQTGSMFGQQRQGFTMGAFNTNRMGSLAGPFSRTASSSMGSTAGFSSSNSFKKSGYSSQGSGSINKSSITSNSTSSMNGLGYSSQNNSSLSSQRSGAVPSKVTLGTLKGVAAMRTYPGIGKSKAISGLKGGTKYSYPGVHNLRWDIQKLQQQKKS